VPNLIVEPAGIVSRAPVEVAARRAEPLGTLDETPAS
jgi:hypothetical protein